MKYSTASISAQYESSPIEVVDLEDVDSENALVDYLWAAFGFDEEDEDGNFPERDDFAGNITFTDPQGFAVHLFRPIKNEDFEGLGTAANFDELLEAWSDESDEDRREAMGEYLDEMGADDLSDFDEAYRGQYADGAAFAQEMAEQLDAVPTENTWICIDWERTWESSVRHDYHITDSGHVFRNL